MTAPLRRSTDKYAAAEGRARTVPRDLRGVDRRRGRAREGARSAGDRGEHRRRARPRGSGRARREPYTAGMADLSSLPSVDPRSCGSRPRRSSPARAGRGVAVEGVRRALAERRRDGVADDDRDAVAAAIAQEALGREGPHLRPVVNATGVIVHTNLGRAPLAREALAAAAAAAGGYANLELDLRRAASRGSRQARVEPLLCALTGAEAALAVNNNAAAVLLVLRALAAGREVLVSRGQLVEIGDGFRIPEILAASGARLVEVGTTNRTRARRLRARDRARDRACCCACTPRTSASSASPRRSAIADAGRARRASAACRCWTTSAPACSHARPGARAASPTPRSSIAAGRDAGLLLGRQAARRPAGRHHRRPRARPSSASAGTRWRAPCASASSPLAALEATLRLHRDPARRAARDPRAADGARAGRRRARAGRAARRGRRRRGRRAPRPGSAAGRCRALALLRAPPRAAPIRAATLAAALRAGDPPVVGRVEDGRLLLDARTLDRRTTSTAVAAAVAAPPRRDDAPLRSARPGTSTTARPRWSRP